MARTRSDSGSCRSPVRNSSDHSHSGYNAARFHLLAHRSPERPRENLIGALLQADAALEMGSTLDRLLLARFVRVEPRDLEVFLERQRAAEAAGYPKLA